MWVIEPKVDGVRRLVACLVCSWCPGGRLLAKMKPEAKLKVVEHECVSRMPGE
jgi:hypothetical protein